jgi:peptidoglycan/LPS O-acetylase OafA/YrhL
MTPSTAQKYRPDVDDFRAIAILLVIGFHAFPSWALGGYVGVDLVFVISGFLITGLVLHDLEKNEFTFPGSTRDVFGELSRR